MVKTYFALILAFTGAPQPVVKPAPQAAVPVKELKPLIDGVDKTFASMKDFKARFIQISSKPLNQSQQDKGLLYLTRDKKMRVDYQEPEKKEFVSNGKTLYTYIPANREVTQVPVKDSLVEQIPLMFLLGRSGLKNEFSEIRELLDQKPLFEGDRVLRLSPKRKNQEIERIEIEVNPRTSLVDRISMFFSDKSSTDFAFFDIETNLNIPASTFEFKAPQGIRVIQGTGTE